MTSLLLTTLKPGTVCLWACVYAEEITDMQHGTVSAVTLDSSGDLAAATSTGGTFSKLEGRVCDTPCQVLR